MAKKKADSKKNFKEKKPNSKTTAKKNDLVKLTDELAQEKEKFLRLFAEFENYKKRTSKERLELFKTAGQDVLQALLPVADDFDRALGQINEKDRNPEIEGFQLIQNKFMDILKAQGLIQIEVGQGDSFDAEKHEAITQLPAPKPNQEGKIIDVVEKGYQLGDKIIRFPKVVVGK